MMRELDGKTAVITGAGRGIGRAIAAELARGGARVVIVSRTTEQLADAVETLSGAGLDVVALEADIDGVDWLEALDRVAPEIDILVNNAAAFASYRPVETVDPAEIDRVLTTCVRSALLLIRHVLPGMKARGFGRIVNVGSVAASLGATGQVAYSTAKAGLVGMTRSVAIESARSGVTCNLLELGLIETERVAEVISPEVQEHFKHNTPVGRAGSVDEVAHAAAFLASPRAAYVTGATIPVCGGLGLGMYPEQLG
ncbi:MAG: hypothetical protein CMJ84_04260 [Planctomycetes bacterium]|jgi:NAD(P)-dependent dehydrogenase (short-subunit alcohol dehydrogenase family)|nr:hypothetical protein [Planctomycetota bacterium]MDP6408471.1 SDR family NAD(P)-dependent oxidoreductase [Planctomycetota bacterium]